MLVPRFEFPNPKASVGTAMRIENFLWHMEQFCKVANVPKVEKVSITSMYLTNDAKLWWRNQVGEDLESGRPQIAEW